MNEYELKSTSRKIELENKLSKLRNNNKDEFLDYCSKNFSLPDCDYLISAYLMSIEKIQ